jgi:hypothetical protein
MDTYEYVFRGRPDQEFQGLFGLKPPPTPLYYMDKFRELFRWVQDTPLNLFLVVQGDFSQQLGRHPCRLKGGLPE